MDAITPNGVMGGMIPLCGKETFCVLCGWFEMNDRKRERRSNPVNRTFYKLVIYSIVNWSRRLESK
jgi:hypothetical protein